MNRLTATVAKAHLNSAAWLIEATTGNPVVVGTRTVQTLIEMQKAFEGITVKITEEDYGQALMILRATVINWEGHDYGLDGLRTALGAYGDAMEADNIATMVREELAKQLNLVLIKVVEIARFSS
jgi:hypothetical protein